MTCSTSGCRCSATAFARRVRGAAEAWDADPFGAIRFGALTVSRDDTVFADRDGVLFVAAEHLDAVLDEARAIYRKEREQAARVKAGSTLREQFRFRDYLAQRDADPALTFRVYLQRINAAIEK